MIKATTADFYLGFYGKHTGLMINYTAMLFTYTVASAAWYDALQSVLSFILFIYSTAFYLG